MKSDFGKRVPDSMRRTHDTHTLPKALTDPDADICKKIPDSLKTIPDTHTMPDPKYDSF